MFRLQNLCNVRIVGLHQRTALQVVTKGCNPDGHHRDRDRYVFKDSPAEVQVAGGILEIRLDQPEKIKGLGEDHPLTNEDQALFVALDVTREQKRERNEPVEDEIQGDDDAPMAAYSIEVPVDLVGQVAGPDDKELTEGQVDVQHDECKGELSKVVLFGRAEKGLERLGLGQADRGQDGEREHGIALAYEEQQTIDGGEPGHI